MFDSARRRRPAKPASHGKSSCKVLVSNVSVFVYQENARSNRQPFSSVLHGGESSAEPPGNYTKVDGKPEVGKNAWNDVHLVGTFHLDQDTEDNGWCE